MNKVYTNNGIEKIRNKSVNLFNSSKDMALKISKNDKPREFRKTIQKQSEKHQKKKMTLRDFFGALKDTYRDALAYQKKVRNEW